MVEKVQSQCSGVTTAVQCLQSGLPVIASIKRDLGHDFIVAYVEMWIVNILDLIGVKNSMNPTQTQYAASLIVDEFYYMNLADINLTMKRVLSGVYGELYENINIPKILSWFRQYSEERGLAASEESYNEAQSMKGPALDSDKRVTEIVSRLLDRVPKKK